MSHGIINKVRDFVYSLVGQGKDWHGLSQEVPEIHKGLFPTFTPIPVWIGESADDLERTHWQVLRTDDDNLPVGAPFDPDSFGYITPQDAWDTVIEALAGTGFKAERVGMLRNRSVWFVSIYLEELARVARSGDRFFLNFSGGLDKSLSPQAELINFRVVCGNTLSASRALGDMLFHIRQTRFAQGRLADAKSEVEKAVGMARIFNETLAGLETQPMIARDARALFAAEVSDRGQSLERKTSDKTGKLKESQGLKLVDTLTTLFSRGDGNNGATRADALNAFTQRFTRGSNEPEKSKRNPWKAVESSEIGNAADRKAEFFALLRDRDKTDDAISRGHKVLADAKAN